MRQLVELSNDLGQPFRNLAILGEGNTSCRLDEESFAVKASGSCLATLKPEDMTVCRFAALLPLLDQGELSDAEIDQALLGARVNEQERKPSTETLFHAWLLTLPGVSWVAHTHPVACNAVLCSGHGRSMAIHRVFPDQVVCCGPESVYVTYQDPGLPLARTLKKEIESFTARTGATPRLCLLENHGIIALGNSPAAVTATTLMAEKAAQIILGAMQMGSPQLMRKSDVTRIHTRLDEIYRQQQLRMV